jgi:lysophospholipase L1-like esterase
VVWLAIGANDYGLAPWSAQDFGEAYAATLDAIHTASPQAVLFAQSPIRQIVEPPNAFGDSFDAYREQIASACTARSGWCVFVDGRDPAFPQPNELDLDGTHLTRESSLKYAEAVRTLLSK